MKKNGDRLIVVLGMHRSGTSTITRCLQVMGVYLGDNLMQPEENNNPKGFWEDVDITELNMEMLSFLNNDGHSLTPIQPSDVDLLRKHGYFLRAVEILRKKSANHPIFGFKDPRVAKLLLFWKEVFAYSRSNVAYLMAIRHPLSVCKSLEKRNGFEFQKSYLSWLEHVINSFVGTQNETCVVVDYDCLMQSPEAELVRIAKGLQLQIDNTELEKFKMEFLDAQLRHTVYQLDDLTLVEEAPLLVRDVYAEALAVATDNIQVEDINFKNNIKKWSEEFSRLKPILSFVDKLESRISQVNRDLSESKQTFYESEQTTRTLSALVAAREQQIQRLNAQLYEIEKSKAWKIAMLLRQIRIFILPPDSWPFRLVAKVFSPLQSSRKK